MSISVYFVLIVSKLYSMLYFTSVKVFKNIFTAISFLYVCMVKTIYLLSFVETPRKFIIIKVLLALMKIRAYGSKALQ